MSNKTIQSMTLCALAAAAVACGGPESEAITGTVEVARSELLAHSEANPLAIDVVGDEYTIVVDFQDDVELRALTLTRYGEVIPATAVFTETLLASNVPDADGLRTVALVGLGDDGFKVENRTRGEIGSVSQSLSSAETHCWAGFLCVIGCCHYLL